MDQRKINRVAACLKRALAVALVAAGGALAADATPLEGDGPALRALEPAPVAAIAPRPEWRAPERAVDLADPTPRAVRMRFEVSAKDEPGRLDAVWSVPRHAWLEPHEGSERGLVRVRVPAIEVEAQLRSTGTDPVEGSFSDFVWLLDPATGEVVAATLSGRVRESVQLGPIRTTAVVGIEVEMSTEREAGFLPGRGFLGLQTNGICDPGDGGRSECVGVRAVRFDRRRGYLNAVGRVRAASTFATVVAFSPLGEIQLTESTSPAADVIVTGPTLSGAVQSVHAVSEGPPVGPSQAEAVCSQAIGAACPADHGGES